MLEFYLLLLNFLLIMVSIDMYKSVYHICVIGESEMYSYEPAIQTFFGDILSTKFNEWVLIKIYVAFYENLLG